MNKEDIDFLISIQDLEQPDFDNACLERENNRLNNIIEELEKILEQIIENSAVTSDVEISKYILNELKELKGEKL